MTHKGMRVCVCVFIAMCNTYTWIYIYIYTIIAFAMKAYLISQTFVRHLVFYTLFPSVILCSNRTNCRFALVSLSNTNSQIHLQLQTCSYIPYVYVFIYIHLYFKLKVNESMSLCWFVALNAQHWKPKGLRRKNIFSTVLTKTIHFTNNSNSYFIR